MDSPTQILEIAERRMRHAGYNAVSYRDIAAEMGIKSASLHYHFPKKADLGVALVRRYTKAFLAELSARTADLNDPTDMIQAFVDVYRHALREEKLVCLCAVLGAEAAGLPEPVEQEVRIFFEGNINWLQERYEALGTPQPLSSAKVTLSLLEGAMIVSATNKDPDVFNAAAEHVYAQCVASSNAKSSL